MPISYSNTSNVVLRRTSFTQFEYLCLDVLPQIGSTIRTLSINTNWTDLLARRFLFYFAYRMQEIFPNVEHLIFVAFSGDELNDYVESIFDLPHLNKLTIHDRYNVKKEYKQILFDKILSANKSRLNKVLFNRHSESLSINPTNNVLYPNIVELSIHLEKITDLRSLLKLIPNIRILYVIIDKQVEDEIIQFDDFIMHHLIEFQMESFRRPWNLDEITALIKQMSCLKRLSLDLFSQDIRLFNGQTFLSILPINTLGTFNYAVDYTPEHAIEGSDDIVLSWSSTPYSVCCLLDDSKSHMFLHTIPYGFSYLDINSVFVKRMNTKTNIYNNRIRELLIFNISTLAEIFVAINNCYKVKDLALEIDDTLSTVTDESHDDKSNLTLTYLNKLTWFSIDGCPSDGYVLKELLMSAPNLYMLILDMKFLLQLIQQDVDQSCISLLRMRIKHVSIEITNDTSLNDNSIEILSNIFSNIRHLIIDNKTSDKISADDIILSVLRYFLNHSLISIIVRGLTTEQLRSNPTDWLIRHTYLKEHINKFQVECDEFEFKIWL